MARIRTIKPEFFTSEVLSECSVSARLLFVGLFTHADDQGRAVDNSRLIRAAVFPLDDFTLSDIDGWLDELAARRLIIRYTAEDRRYLVIRSWKEHQYVNRPSASKLPAPPDDPTVSDLSESSVRVHGDRTEDSAQERKGKERKEVSSQVSPVATETTTAPVDNSTERHHAIADAYGRLMADAHNAGNRSGYATRAATNLLTERRADVDRYITTYPTAPCDVIAAALAGQPGSLRYYTDRTTTEDPPAVDLVEPF